MLRFSDLGRQRCLIDAGFGTEPVVGVGEWKTLVAGKCVGFAGRGLWLQIPGGRILWVSGSYMSPVHWDYLCDGDCVLPMRVSFYCALGKNATQANEIEQATRENILFKKAFLWNLNPIKKHFLCENVSQYDAIKM